MFVDLGGVLGTCLGRFGAVLEFLGDVLEKRLGGVAAFGGGCLEALGTQQ